MADPGRIEKFSPEPDHPDQGPYWYHHDGLGSVSDVTSATGTSLW